jgi:hypothetical protein
MNLAQQIQHALGIPVGAGFGSLNPNSTKSGPGRKHKQGDGSRTAKQKSAGAFGRGLRNMITRNNLAALA